MLPVAVSWLVPLTKDQTLPVLFRFCSLCAGVAAGAPQLWRLRRQNLAAAAGFPAAAFDAAGSYGAFAGLRVVLYGSSEAPSFTSLARMLKAGGGDLLRKGPPYASCLPAPAPAAAGSKKGAGAAGKDGGCQGRASAGAAGRGLLANLAVIGTGKTADDRWVCCLCA